MKTGLRLILSTVLAGLFIVCNGENEGPFVYDKGYNISFYGFENLHPFEAAKYKKVYNRLLDRGLQKKHFCSPQPVTDAEFQLVHTPEYLQSLKNSLIVLDIAEMVPSKTVFWGVPRWFMSWTPNSLLQSKLLDPMRFATGGTLLAAKLALKNGKAAVNLGGGYHHAKKDEIEKTSFCFFGDIQFAIEKLWQKNPHLKVMIIDLDAHQGNGYESYFKDDERVTMFDVHNCDKEHREEALDKYIKYNFPVHSGITDEPYLKILRNNVVRAIAETKPGLVIYNAGTDILEGDEEGEMNISAQGIIQRDELVFKAAQKRKIPVAMLLSGGYTKRSADVIADSLINLMEEGCIPI